MAYRVEFEREAAKAFKGLPAPLKRRIARQLDGLAADPRPDGCKALQGSGASLYRVRVGSYRVIYRIRDDVLVILVLRIAPRGDAYKHLDD